MRALVLDGEARSALAVTRSLGRAGIEVTVGAASRRSLAGASRYASGHLVLPDPVREPEAFATTLIRQAERRAPELWLPLTDASMAVVNDIRHDLAGILLPMPPADTLALAWDKGRLLDSAAAAGVACPRTHRPGSPGEVERLAPELDYPIVLKPRMSRWRTAQGFRLGEVSYVERAAELPAAWLEQHRQVPEPLIQEYIPGYGMGVFILAREGRVLARFAHRRLREKPPTGGVSVLRESIAVPESVLGPATRLIAALAWDGVCMIEFRVDARDGTPYLMEINPRFWGSLQLAIDAGVDFPYLLYRLATGDTPAPRTSYRLGVRCRWLLGDLDHLLIRLRRPERREALPPHTPPRWRALLDFLDPRAGRLEVMRWSDPGPGCYELGRYLRELLGRDGGAGDAASESVTGSTDADSSDAPAPDGDQARRARAGSG